MERARSRPLADAERQPILTQGRDAILGEARALLTMAEALDDSFVDAVLALIATPGRVAVSGLGKSGHVARKIAATLTSGGSSALFIHSGDAAHGDRGALIVVEGTGEAGAPARVAGLVHAHDMLALGVV